MRLRPRHYLLIALVLALGVYNLVRSVRARHEAPTAAGGPGGALAGRPSSPAWASFDHAAGMRDAPEPQFTPALEALRTQANAAGGNDGADLRNCLMWLEYYRHSVPMAGGNANSWGMLATSHVQTCMTEHRDTGR